ncbi:MAG: SPOR domain-containing protein [Desulfobacterales bacterium]|jgi:hypothetical protein
MISFLKNSAFRIWIAGLVAFALSLVLLPQTGEAFSLTKPLLFFSLLFGAAFAGIGWLTDRIVRIQLRPLLREAGILERGGMGLEAERAFDNALALLDSFMVSPRRRRHYLQILGERMARFYAAQAEKSDRAFKWITRYLHVRPGDGAIAEIWLRDMESQSTWTKAQQDLAARIGEVRKEDRPIQSTLARIYIQAGRTDFPALQTYRRIMEDNEGGLGAMSLDLARLFIREGRADELALRAYVHAARQGEPPAEDILCGLAACLRWIQTSARTRVLMAQANAVLGPLSDDQMERMASGFLPPTGRTTTPVAKAAQPGDRIRSGYSRISRISQKIGERLRQGLRFAAQGLESPGLRRHFKAGAIAGLALAAIVLLLNTAGHLIRSPEAPPAQPPEIAVKIAPTPYTLQVAAYLKPEHAEGFIQTLKAKGQEAYRVEAQSGPKTWYQVRVGHFPTKAAARAHGQQLKTAGIIEDFYVANYAEP